jgi:hypothetical protein
MPDKIRTMQTANAVVDSIEFIFDAAGTVTAVVTGHTTYAEGGNSPISAHSTVLPTGAFKTDVLNMRTNRALPFWKTQEGL